MEDDRNSKKLTDEKRLPVAEEDLEVGKRTVETGITRVSIRVSENEEVIQQPLMKDTVEIRRVAIDRFIDAPAEVRTEGDTTIVPVMEEVLVLEKKLRLKEELHIRRVREVVTTTHKETLRKEEAFVEHVEPVVTDSKKGE